LSESNYLVARLNGTVFVRSLGLANMKNAPMLSVFLQEMINQGVRVVCIDLSECTGMDSTFMGLLVGFSQALTPMKGKMVVVNPSQTNLKLLNMLGVSEVLPVVAQTDPADLEFIRIPSNPAMTPMQRMELVKQAHHHLMAISEANQGKFAAFLKALDTDMVKMRDKFPFA
jgi:anti-sigma B factor antagonist